MATSKQSPKSIWTTFPVLRSRSTFEGCRSPRPRIWPTILFTARDRVYVALRSNQCSELMLFNHKTRYKS
jgi:hypothetical protein